jgi:hypothetical protein
MNNVELFWFFANFGIINISFHAGVTMNFIVLDDYSPSIFSYSTCLITHNNEVFNGNANNTRGCQQIHDGWFSYIWVTTHYKKLTCIIACPLYITLTNAKKAYLATKFLC